MQHNGNSRFAPGEIHLGRSIRDVPLSSDWHNHTINRALDNAHVQTQIKSISVLKTADSVIQPSTLNFNLCIGHMQNIPSEIVYERKQDFSFHVAPTDKTNVGHGTSKTQGIQSFYGRIIFRLTKEL